MTLRHLRSPLPTPRLRAKTDTNLKDAVNTTGTRRHFFKSFVRNPRGVGSLCPSSSRLADATLRHAELEPEDVVLEYGPGTGALTGPIKRCIELAGGSGAGYLGIEREKSFYDLLTIRLPDLAFAHGSVEDVRDHLKGAGLAAPKLVVSGLPLILMPATTTEEIIRTTYEILEPGGSFRTFSYLQTWPTAAAKRLRAMMREVFDHVELSPPVWRNLPPAYVLRGDKTGRKVGREPGP